MDRIIKSYNDIDITSEQYGELLSPRDWITAIVDILCKIKGEPQFYYDNLLSIKEIIGVKENEPLPDYFKNLVELSKSITDFDLFKERAEEELKSTQKRYFQILYNLLLGTSKGPKLGLFLLALDKDKVKELI